MRKVYTLHNGYSLSTDEFYDGLHEITRWCVYAPNGTLYVSFDSYEEAYEFASHLVGAPDYDKLADYYYGCFDEF